MFAAVMVSALSGTAVVLQGCSSDDAQNTTTAPSNTTVAPSSTTTGEASKTTTASADTTTAPPVVDSAQVAMGATMTWETYKQQFAKVWNGDEDSLRKAVFEENKKLWGQHASGAILGATVFSDMTPEEFKAANIRGVGGSSQFAHLPDFGVLDETPVEAETAIDWTTKGAVTPVKNQGSCGAGWAFSATGALEGAWQISSGELVSMSEQQLTDCVGDHRGCMGGGASLIQGFEWAEQNAIATESSYPFSARDEDCKSTFTVAIPKGAVTGYKTVTPTASGLTNALMNSPVSVAIEADQSVFQQYIGGVIQSGCGTNLDHSVLAVGVNSDGSIKVKNSWGTSWGANGYVNIASNQCGITQQAAFPLMSSSVSV